MRPKAPGQRRAGARSSGRRKRAAGIPIACAFAAAETLALSNRRMMGKWYNIRQRLLDCFWDARHHDDHWTDSRELSPSDWTESGRAANLADRQNGRGRQFELKTRPGRHRAAVEIRSRARVPVSSSMRCCRRAKRRIPRVRADVLRSDATVRARTAGRLR